MSLDILEDGKVVGATRGAKIRKRWNPKKWKPEYEFIVGLHIQGISSVEIARRTGFHEVHIGNIVNCDHARAIKEKVLGKLHEQVVEDLPTQLAFAQKMATKRVVDVLKNDTLAVNSPMAIFDRSLAFLRFQQGGDPSSAGAQVAGGGTTTINNIQQNNFTLLTEQAQSLNAGVAKALEVERLHAESKFITGASGDLRESKESGQEVHAVLKR